MIQTVDMLPRWGKVPEGGCFATNMLPLWGKARLGLRAFATIMLDQLSTAAGRCIKMFLAAATH